MYLAIAYLWALNTSELAMNQYEQIHQLKTVRLSDEQIINLLKVEDPSFYKNSGLDVFTPGQGKTTLTQTVVPILLFRAKLHGWRGVLQKFYSKVWFSAKKIDLGRDVMAVALSKKVSKEKILQVFIDRVYMGSIENEAIYGLSQAANKYFKKSISELSRDEFVKLISMLKSPDSFHPIKNPEALMERSNKILKLLSGSCTPQGLFDTDYSLCA